MSKKRAKRWRCFKRNGLSVTLFPNTQEEKMAAAAAPAAAAAATAAGVSDGSVSGPLAAALGCINGLSDAHVAALVATVQPEDGKGETPAWQLEGGARDCVEVTTATINGFPAPTWYLWQPAGNADAPPRVLGAVPLHALGDAPKYGAEIPATIAGAACTITLLFPIASIDVALVMLPALPEGAVTTRAGPLTAPASDTGLLRKRSFRRIVTPGSAGALVDGMLLVARSRQQRATALLCNILKIANDRN